MAKKGKSKRATELGSLQEKALKYIAEEAPKSINVISKSVGGSNSYKNMYDIYQKFSKRGYIRLLDSRIWLTYPAGLTQAILVDANLGKIRLIANENLQGKELTEVLMLCDWRVDMGPDIFRATDSYLNNGELDLNELFSMPSVGDNVRIFIKKYPDVKKMMRAMFVNVLEELKNEDP